jgi:spermidine synthase
MSRHRGREPASARRIEVRQVGEDRELLLDGSFASLYRPGSSVTGSVWDAIAAPLLALAPERRSSVLLLGLGGGSAARVVRALAPRAEIVGVELDPEVVRVARRRLDLDELGIEIVIRDAQAFLVSDKRCFDIVLEDVFVGSGDDVYKPDWLPRPGHALAARRVAPGGLLVSNTLDEFPAVAQALGELFPALLRIDVEDYDNRIVVAGPEGLGARKLRRAVARSPVLRDTLPRLSFRTLRPRRTGAGPG